MNHEMKKAFEELECIRNHYFSTPEFNGEIYHRKETGKWSIGEVIYHCYLLLKLTRTSTRVYLPAAKLIKKMGHFNSISYDNTMHNIYEGETMKAPKVLAPKMDRPYSKGELRLMLESETSKLKRLVENLKDEEAYWIRYPDPVPGYPNIVQAVKLVKIHEAHHYKVLMQRERG